MVIGDMVYIDIWVVLDCCGDSLVLSQIKDGRRQVIHASGDGPAFV